MTPIPYKSYDSLPVEVESFPDLEKLSLVISPEVVFPILPGNDFRLETQTEFLSYNYRIKFLHPSLYCGAAFANDGYAKLDVLRKLAKRGATITFIVDSQQENSLINACCFLGECFNDCRNKRMPITNIPFPVKKEDDEPHNWIWSCYWDEHFPERLDEEQSKEFIDTVCLDFPKYDSRYFPVKAIGSNEEGVTAFSVKVGNGKVLVVTPDMKHLSLEESKEPINDKVLALIHVEDKQKSAVPDMRFLKAAKTATTPQLIIAISKPERREKFAVEVNGETRNATLSQVLKFLAIYAANTTPEAHYLFQNDTKVIIRKGSMASDGEFCIKCIYSGIKNVSGDVDNIFETFLPKRPDLDNYIEKTEKGRFPNKKYGIQEVIIKNIHVTLDTVARNAIDAELNKEIVPGLKQFILDALR